MWNKCFGLPSTLRCTSFFPNRGTSMIEPFRLTQTSGPWPSQPAPDRSGHSTNLRNWTQDSEPFHAHPFKQRVWQQKMASQIFEEIQNWWEQLKKACWKLQKEAHSSFKCHYNGMNLNYIFIHGIIPFPLEISCPGHVETIKRTKKQPNSIGRSSTF